MASGFLPFHWGWWAPFGSWGSEGWGAACFRTQSEQCLPVASLQPPGNRPSCTPLPQPAWPSQSRAPVRRAPPPSVAATRIIRGRLARAGNGAAAARMLTSGCLCPESLQMHVRTGQTRARPWTSTTTRLAARWAPAALPTALPETPSGPVPVPPCGPCACWTPCSPFSLDCSQPPAYSCPEDVVSPQVWQPQGAGTKQPILGTLAACVAVRPVGLALNSASVLS